MIKTTLILDGVTVMNLTPLQRLFRNFHKTILRPEVMDRIGRIVSTEQEERIWRQQQVGGSPLRPLTEPYGSRKRGRYKLVESGSLFPFTSYARGKNRMVKSNNPTLAGWLDVGTKRMKEFNFFGVDERMEKPVYEYLDKVIEDAFK